MGGLLGETTENTRLSHMGKLTYGHVGRNIDQAPCVKLGIWIKWFRFWFPDVTERA